MRSERFFQAHPVKLTGEEVADRAQEGAKLLGESEEKSREIERHKEEAASTKKRLEGEKETLDAKCYKLGRIVRAGAEERQVECEERDIMTALTIDTVRLDTGAVVGSRAMTKEEILDRQQIKIPLPKAEKPRKGEPTPEALAEVKAIGALLRSVGHAAEDTDVEAHLGELAGFAEGMQDRGSIVAALRLAAKDKRRPEATRKAIVKALAGIEAGAHLAKSN